MDLFIGLRMYATIATLTSNAPVVYTGCLLREIYCIIRKCGLPVCSRSTNEDTQKIVQAVIDRIENDVKCEYTRAITYVKTLVPRFPYD